MKILGIDTSSASGSVALLDNNCIVSESLLDGSPAYSDKLLAEVDSILKRAQTKLNDLEGFVITKGPGSFTGLRVGMSLLKGLILATEKPFATVNTLDAYAETVPSGPYLICPVLDARKKEVYTALFDSKKDVYERKTPDQAISPAKLCDQINQPTLFVGNGLEIYEELFTSRLKGNYVHNAPMKSITVAASAGLIASRDLKNNLNYNLDSLMINYVRPSEAELNYTVSK
ncbi:MAG: tRNA (adenosine(37)-N6)-threonylcarbamoyltransferase complex dimerization subunit type 1 TsaB [Nitrospinae bacterium]|nr:tRNA (adenosine(37)-N6)-threonylcarbamoyltransferase complex dimerization subunit type 1 TsaB [Nitrospinota bacterium]